MSEARAPGQGWPFSGDKQEAGSSPEARPALSGDLDQPGCFRGSGAQHPWGGAVRGGSAGEERWASLLGVIRVGVERGPEAFSGESGKGF